MQAVLSLCDSFVITFLPVSVVLCCIWFNNDDEVEKKKCVCVCVIIRTCISAYLIVCTNVYFCVCTIEYVYVCMKKYSQTSLICNLSEGTG